MGNEITAVWTMTIDEDVLVKEMLESGEYGIDGYPINTESMMEFFRNWAFGLDPDTYRELWARNTSCYYDLKILAPSGKELWWKTFLRVEGRGE